MASQEILELCDLGPKGELGKEICLILWRSEIPEGKAAADDLLQSWG